MVFLAYLAEDGGGGVSLIPAAVYFGGGAEVYKDVGEVESIECGFHGDTGFIRGESVGFAHGADVAKEHGNVEVTLFNEFAFLAVVVCARCARGLLCIDAGDRCGGTRAQAR